VSCIFGPVPSRRLGRSLGVDLVPFKTCSYDCLYCQLGLTTRKTAERREWIPLDQVLSELAEKLPAKPDWITLSGSGEPTLYSRLDELIGGIHKISDVPVAVLTNGSLLGQPDVRAQLAQADLVIPSLDAGSPAVFETINRPAPEIDFEAMLNGLILFREEFAKPIWLEILLLEGINSSREAVRDLIDCAGRIAPDRIQLNTATRPPADPRAAAVSKERLQQIARQFNPAAEVIADYRGIHAQTDFQNLKNSVLELLDRRPCTLDDIAAGLGIHRNEAVKYIEELQTAGRLSTAATGSRLYYQTNRKGNTP
jgi:wyosine [tRNA(Phe)-imidazoG37] synthetase (radical SAM superfamily)